MTVLACVQFFATFTILSAFLVSFASAGCTQIVVAENSALGYDEEEFGNCSEDQFECRNRECIHRDLLCDGKADCSDQSDETQSECTRPGLNCPHRAFRCDYGACVHENASCNGVKDCLDNSDELLPECPRAPLHTSSPVYFELYDDERDQKIVPTRRRIYKVKSPGLHGTSTSLQPHPRPSKPLPLLTPLSASGKSTPIQSFCIVPPQPLNGRWKLHRRFCKGNNNCDIPRGIALQVGTRLVFSCVEGFMVRGNSEVHCGAGGNWSSTPICVVTTCTPLNSMSRAATCSRFGDRVSSRSPVLPYTKAKVTCRINYGLKNTFITGMEQDVECNPHGKWDPEPITCSPVCGVVSHPGQERKALSRIAPQPGAFPWHANLWKEVHSPRGPEIEFRCSATIVETKFVVTAAHCVIDENTGTTIDPKLFGVTSGRSVDDESNATQISPWLHKVKNVYRYCEYFGLLHGFVSDIAIVELQDPFQFSPLVLPACLDVSSYSEQALKPGTTGRIDGFGRSSTNTPSPVLQILEVTYVTNSECKMPHHPSKGNSGISKDEFCGAYSNETTVCDWDNGGGFVVKKDGLWHLMGIFIMDLGWHLDGSHRTCGENPFALYTKVPTYMAWIQDVMFQVERYKSYPVCSFDVPPSTTTTMRTPQTTTSHLTTTTPGETTAVTSSTTSTPSTTAVPVENRGDMDIPEFSCLAPPQPANGEWRLHPDLCNNTNCNIPQGVVLEPGSQLVYSCASGFRVRGNSDVFCGTRGRWSATPQCIEITCSSLESISRMVTCYRANAWAPCNSSSLPGTRAVTSCRVGYREDTNSLRNGDRTVECNENGEWEPNPITCYPVCGVKNTRLTPTIINGTAANITDFPWHATLYRQMNITQGPKEFICGATIIQNNLLLTAAHCVYDDVVKAVEIPEKFSVAAGNSFRDYDSPLHDPRVVQKSMVKNIYVPCEYFGFQGNYASDIAIIELREPFQLSDVLLPACLDVVGNSDQILEPGAVGKFAGFGRTATSPSSAVLLMTDIPYIGYSQCRMTQSGDTNLALIVQDKFCGGNTEGMGVCTGDSGGGLTFDDAGVSNVMGILSVNLGADTSTGERTCDSTAFSLYTKVSNHMPWIRNVMRVLAANETYPSCGSR